MPVLQVFAGLLVMVPIFMVRLSRSLMNNCATSIGYRAKVIAHGDDELDFCRNAAFDKIGR